MTPKMCQNLDITCYFRVMDALHFHIKNVFCKFEILILILCYLRAKTLNRNSETLFWTHIIKEHNGTIKFKIYNNT
jgi:hypothetical protein